MFINTDMQSKSSKNQNKSRKTTGSKQTSARGDAKAAWHSWVPVTLLVLGGDVIRGFVFAMTFGIVIGTYSSIFVASAVLLRLGVKRDWSKPDGEAGTQFANVDA